MPDVATTARPDVLDPECVRGVGRPRDNRINKAIAQAAMRLLADDGYAAVTMDAVASEAGVSRATLYRRFKDKADLITTVIATHGAVPLPDASPVDPKDSLASFLEEFDARFAESCLEVIGGLLGSRESPEAMAQHRSRVIAPRLDYLSGLLRQAVGRGELRSDADLDLALQMLLGAVFARRVTGTESRPGWAREAVEIVWAGLG